MDPTSSSKTLLHSIKPMPFVILNRIFAVIYTIALLCLFYHHVTQLSKSTTSSSFLVSISMFIADLLLGFMWITCQAFRLRPVTRQVFPENLEKIIKTSDDGSVAEDFPAALDIFICTADPEKEPPINVVNTALSMLAYDYPPEKLSVYVSDDGGSELTLFAFMRAAKFGAHWLAFCRENKVMDRCPDVFFRSNNYHPIKSDQSQKIKIMYDNMRNRIQNATKSTKVEEYINESEHEAFSKWTDDFTRENHPAVIQVLLESNKDKDVTGHPMPNLVYVSREKRRTSPHHFKAGALNTLIRVSAIMTNAPIILTQDCDMFSNDPRTPYNVQCYFMDTSIQPTLAYIQFPQCFHGLNKNDIYSSEMKRWFIMNPRGMDGVLGPDNMGSGSFFMRRAFFGGPSSSSFIDPRMPQLSPLYHNVSKSTSIRSENILELADIVAGCDFEKQTKWGSEVGFRYGSLVEDYFTGYRLHSLGWKSIFCNPQRPAFLGDVPNSLFDVVNQHKRWCVGLLEVLFSKFSPLTFGMQTLGPIESLCYASYAFSPMWSFPITLYSFIPQLALLNNHWIFPKVSSIWFLVYVFLFLGSYIQDSLEFMLAQGTFARWWNEQRIWSIRGFTSYLFGSLEYLLKILNFSTHGFNVTNKVVDDEQSKRYHQGIFDFGPPSSFSSFMMFLPLATAAVVNFVAFFGSLMQIFKGSLSGDINFNVDGGFLQLFLCGFGVLNCLPVYEAMVMRNDKGRMPLLTTICSICLAWGLCLAT
ncbi:OLC1v1018734C1 [Oldenlandia corymbosa var. corymbosa]|uniref:OLC1v1018734C1 n=1 Tax=Oldenlandia corymbosa var. corymbosa TaxID=529605 RepID=A0AAV1ECA6_OLDCO|nr:OLC1v1018734C1 [Oldenlandia corymbosa var. corymbosa]